MDVATPSFYAEGLALGCNAWATGGPFLVAEIGKKREAPAPRGFALHNGGLRDWLVGSFNQSPSFDETR
jgi:hypothetical protein